jgi:4-hydroxysphinganine ceramide fatty acyl 2-hydroxylase
MLGLIGSITTTRWNYWLCFVVDAITVMLLLTIGLMKLDLSFATVVLSALSGYLFFTLIEYLIHARLFHGRPRKLIRPFVVGHWSHHKNPAGYDSLPFFFASGLTAVNSIIFSQFLPVAGVTAFFAGFLVGYIVYGLFHFLLHRIEWQHGYMAYMQRFHERHHEKPRTNMGVTSPLWDIVFRTGDWRNRK